MDRYAQLMAAMDDAAQRDKYVEQIQRQFDPAAIARRVTQRQALLVQLGSTCSMQGGSVRGLT